MTMKYGIKKFNEDELAMMGAVVNLDYFDAKSIMIRKGDIEKPTSYNHQHSINWVPLRDTLLDDSFEMPKGKSMKRANRRKATFHKREQRKQMYLNKGYTIENLDERDIGMLSEGVGAVPKALHMDSMYLHGDKAKKKMEKPITALDAVAMMEHERWLDEQDAATALAEAEKAFAQEYISDMKYEVKRLTEMMEDTETSIIELENHLDELRKQFYKAAGMKRHLLYKIAELEEFVNN